MTAQSVRTLNPPSAVTAEDIRADEPSSIDQEFDFNSILGAYIRKVDRIKQELTPDPISRAITGEPLAARMHYYSVSGSTVGHYFKPPHALEAETSRGPSLVPVLVPGGVIAVHISPEATLKQEYPNEVEQKIEALFEAAKDEFFEDGMESNFSQELILIIKKYNDAAIRVLSYLILSRKVNAAIAAEALHTLGSMEYPISYAPRRELLRRSLFSPSPIIRDGALLGLSALGDTSAGTIDSLKRALKQESVKLLRKNMNTVLAKLETQRCRSF